MSLVGCARGRVVLNGARGRGAFSFPALSPPCQSELLGVLLSHGSRRPPAAHPVVSHQGALGMMRGYLECPEHAISHILGPTQEVAYFLQVKTGASIQVTTSVNGMRMIAIVGTAVAVQQVQQHLQHSLSHFQQMQSMMVPGGGIPSHPLGFYPPGYDPSMAPPMMPVPMGAPQMQMTPVGWPMFAPLGAPMGVAGHPFSSAPLYASVPHTGDPDAPWNAEAFAAGTYPPTLPHQPPWLPHQTMWPHSSPLPSSSDASQAPPPRSQQPRPPRETPVTKPQAELEPPASQVPMHEPPECVPAEGAAQPTASALGSPLLPPDAATDSRRSDEPTDSLERTTSGFSTSSEKLERTTSLGSTVASESTEEGNETSASTGHGHSRSARRRNQRVRARAARANELMYDKQQQMVGHGEASASAMSPPPYAPMHMGPMDHMGPMGLMPMMALPYMPSMHVPTPPYPFHPAIADAAYAAQRAMAAAMMHMPSSALRSLRALPPYAPSPTHSPPSPIAPRAPRSPVLRSGPSMAMPPHVQPSQVSGASAPDAVPAVHALEHAGGRDGRAASPPAAAPSRPSASVDLAPDSAPLDDLMAQCALSTENTVSSECASSSAPSLIVQEAASLLNDAGVRA